MSGSTASDTDTTEIWPPVDMPGSTYEDSLYADYSDSYLDQNWSAWSIESRYGDHSVTSVYRTLTYDSSTDIEE